MFLNKTIEELKSNNLGSSNTVLDNYDVLKKYFQLRFKQDKETKIFKSEQKIQKDEALELLFFSMVSDRRINNAYTIVTKLYDDEYTYDELAEKIFKLSFDDVKYNHVRELYYAAESSIKEYCIIRMRLNSEYKLFKSKHQLALKIIRDELIGNGFIPAVLNNMYTNIKVSINNFKEISANDIEILRSTALEQYKNSSELLMTEIFLEEIENV